MMDPDFLEPEVRCGYAISAKMKRVWAVELDLLDTFSKVCEENGLCYFLDGGTLLGAVRHQGFIPWDDDVDVIMPRRDYDRLCAMAGEVFHPPYFFQTTLTDPGVLRTHAQLRNSDTTGYITADTHRTMNKGIFLDIFVLDAIPDRAFERWCYGRAVEIGRRLFWLTDPAPENGTASFRGWMRKIAHVMVQKIPLTTLYRIYDRRVLARYAGRDTAMVGDMTLGWRENVHWKRNWFEDQLMLPFETLQLRVPGNYEAVLKRQYGDFMSFPPPERRGENQHDAVFWDPDRPYTYYFLEEEH